VLKDVNYSGLLEGTFLVGLVLHNTEKTVQILMVCQTEIQQGLDFIWELGELHEDILLVSHSEESC